MGASPWKASAAGQALDCAAIAAGALCAVAGWGLWDTRLAQQKADALFAYSESAHSAMTGLRESVATMLHVQTQIVALGSSNVVETERLIDLWNGEVARVLESSRRIASNAGEDAQVRTLVDTQHKLVQTYTQAVDPVLKQLKGATMEPQVALAFIGQAEPTLNELKKAVVDLDKLQAQRLDERKAEAAASAQVMAAWRLAVGALALFVPFMWLTRQSICQPLDVATALACRIAQGDLTGTIRTEGKDEPARLLHALGEMQDSLRRIVGDVRDGADNIQVASHEVAQGNADLSNRTEQTASNLQQAAGSMSHLTDAVRQSAESARLANQLATSAAEVARRGGNVVSEVVSTMDEINSSSKKISDIIGVIDGIAFQTNILALNAAVEAARAGEQGRGFAVVASEVRSLAGRSAEAAKEIKSLIGSSVGKVEAGSRLVGEAGETMQEIVASVQRVCDMINAITSTAAEQSDGIGQINATVGQLDQMTQQNSALVEQSAAAAESLKDQAQKLASTVATFRMQPA